MKKISILGSTGSVGAQSLDVIRNLKKFEVVALSAGKNINLLESQIKKFNPKFVCISSKNDAEFLSEKFRNVIFFHGIEGLQKIAQIDESEMVLNAVAGFTGIYASVSAIEAGKSLVLANKESIVAGAHFLMNLAKEKKCQMLPIDSEHNAIWQCIDGKEKFLRRIILTASGGPFFGLERKNLKNVTKEQVIKHPTWKMGAKISVDSATMMNKGLEIIEAAHLFGVPASSIDVLIHPQSIVHSMVEFIDGNIISQMSVPDMRFPIQYALTYPERFNYSNGFLDLSNVCNLSFYNPSDETNRILNLCRESSKDNSLSCALNAVNEVAVGAFLNKKISFLDIESIIFQGMDKFNSLKISSLSDIIECDRIAREVANNFVTLRM